MMVRIENETEITNNEENTMSQNTTTTSAQEVISIDHLESVLGKESDRQRQEQLVRDFGQNHETYDPLTQQQRINMDSGMSINEMLIANGVHPTQQIPVAQSSNGFWETAKPVLTYTLGAVVVAGIAYAGYKLLTSDSEAAPE